MPCTRSAPPTRRGTRRRTREWPLPAVAGGGLAAPRTGRNRPRFLASPTPPPLPTIPQAVITSPIRASTPTLHGAMPPVVRLTVRPLPISGSAWPGTLWWDELGGLAHEAANEVIAEGEPNGGLKGLGSLIGVGVPDVFLLPAPAVDQDRHRVRVAPNRVAAVDLPQPAILATAERRLGDAVDHRRVVVHHRSRLELLANPHGLLGVLGEDAAAQAIPRVVGESHSLVLVRDPHDGDHRAEGLFAHQVHVVGQVDNDGGPVEQALGGVGLAADQDGRPLGPGVLDVAADDVQLPAPEQRA